MSENQIKEALRELLEGIAADSETNEDFINDEALIDCSTTDYHDSGLLTGDTGLVLQLTNGENYHITIQQNAN